MKSCMSINWNLKIKLFACRRRWEFQDLYIAQRWGKLYWQEFDETSYEAYLDETPLQPYTENTITNVLKLNQELREVRQLKIAFDDEEMEKDIFCIGAALFER